MENKLPEGYTSWLGLYDNIIETNSDILNHEELIIEKRLEDHVSSERISIPLLKENAFKELLENRLNRTEVRKLETGLLQAKVRFDEKLIEKLYKNSINDYKLYFK